MSKGWTEERRKAQAERCRKNKPWENATGPKTMEGKARASMNAFKTGKSQVFDDGREMLRQHKRFLKLALLFVQAGRRLRIQK